MNSKVIAAVAAVIIIIGGVLFVGAGKTSEKTSTSATTSTSQSSTSSNSTETSSANTITYSGSGFSPATITVKSGDQIKVVNNSSGDLQFESDPHPQHTDDTELNIGIISAGENKTITVTTTGSHGYHNHFNSSDTGTIVVN